jgi:hypothetical protein
MFDSILERLGFGRRKATVQTLRLEVIAEQVREFNEAKAQINQKIGTLETKTDELDDTIHKTLDMTRENQQRLTGIEDSLQRIISISEATMARKGQAVRADNPPEGPKGP